jgi:hypothetical protein
MFAVLTHQPRRVALFHSLADAERGLVAIATDWANREVGAKHVHSALENGRALAEFPDGLCLQREELAGERSIVAVQKRTLAGWLSSSVEYDRRNQFSLLPVELPETDFPLDLPLARPTPTVLQSRGGSMSYAAVLAELRDTLTRRRSAMRLDH